VTGRPAVDYDRAAADYHRSRGATAGTAAWREPVLRVLVGAPAGPVVDLGAGTGAWSGPLAAWTGRPVVAVEPSAGMRAEAARTTRDEPAVHLVAGRGGAVPLRDGVAGAAWLSTVLHHVGDVGACARDLRRVLAPGAPVVIRGALAGRYDGIPLVRYFPTVRAVLDRFPSLAEARAAFEAAGFAFAGVERVDEAPVDLRAWRARVPGQRRVDTTLVGLSDGEFAAGLAAIDAAVAGGRRVEVVGLDLLAFR
jgi:SAM-dependent methyltransferase